MIFRKLAYIVTDSVNQAIQRPVIPICLYQSAFRLCVDGSTS